MAATQNAEVNDRIGGFVGELVVKIVCGTVSVPQAVQAVNNFADKLRGTVPDDELSDARTFMTDFVFAAQESMQKGNATASRKQYSEMTLDELVEIAVHNRKAGRPRDAEADKWFWIRRKERYGPIKITWHTDPRELGLKHQTFNPDDIPWQEREPWRTIKRSLPPAMIDTDEKERKAAWRIGFLLGYGAEKAAAAAIREYGLLGGAATIALFAWACEQIRRN
jgi:hypothetical protein